MISSRIGGALRKGVGVVDVKERKWTIAAFVVLIFLLVGCSSELGSESFGSANTEATSTNPEIGDELILDNGNIYAVENFSSAGFKAVTQFELETLPGAVDAWYGFHSQKDLELRFYKSHDSAVSDGLDLARVAAGKTAVGYSRHPPRRWDAYAVVGNVVMLCELEIETCKNLISELE